MTHWIVDLILGAAVVTLTISCRILYHMVMVLGERVAILEGVRQTIYKAHRGMRP